MIAPEILAQVRRIEIITNKLVSETFAGEYLSVFKGRGMEFSEVREYVPGDDVRSIDWNVTARAGRPFVKIHSEERELVVAIACDLSGSQFFGSRGRLKKEIAAEIAAVLAFSALRNNDKAGLLLFTNGVEEYMPPRKARSHVLRLIRDLLAFNPRGRGTDIKAVLDAAMRVLRRRSILFLISDFRDEGFEQTLKLCSLKHDLIPVVITDPLELNVPELPATIEVSDPETGRRALVDARSRSLLAAHSLRERRRLETLQDLFERTGLDPIRVSTDRPYIDPLIQFFRTRIMKLRR